MVSSIREEMQRLAQGLAASSARGGQVCTVQIEGGYSAFVFVDHDARHITLLDVMRGRPGPKSP